MDDDMARLIILPQYPTPLRYQQWWWDELPKQFAPYFDDVIRLGSNYVELDNALFPDTKETFAPLKKAVTFEAEALVDLFDLNLQPDDCLLLCDLSYPGIAANAVLHLPCKKFAICHATSKNRYDYFQPIRNVKWPLEKAQAKLFDKIFVGSKYHQEKLGWSNTVVTYLPLPPNGLGGGYLRAFSKYPRPVPLVSVSRDGRQKRLRRVEKWLVEDLKLPIVRPGDIDTWEQYIQFLRKAQVMVITSQEETFGYQVIDALRNGVFPLAPNAYSYPELLPRWCLYDDYDELVERVKAILGKTIFKPNEPYLKPGIECSLFYETLAKEMKE